MKATTIQQLIDQQGDSCESDIFLTSPSTDAATDISFSQMKKRATQIAAYLDVQGVQPGESVAFAMSNGPDCALCLLGILYGGYRVTAVNLAAGKHTIGYVLTHSESVLILTQSAHVRLLEDAQAVDPATTGAPIVEINESWWSALPESKTQPRQVAPEDDGLLMYTSGTTGQPKGVVLSHANLIAAGHNPTLAHKLTPADRALCVLPLYHINGFCTTVMAPLYSGSSVMLPDRFSRSRFWEWAREGNCTWFSVVPTHISYLVHEGTTNPGINTGLSRIRFGRSASAPLAPDVQQAFEDLYQIPIVETMGLTETGGQILSNPLPPGLRKIGSPGVAIGCEVIIADKQQIEVEVGTEGEILIRGSNVMQRYLKNDQVTAETVTEDGWLRTGDLGRKDSDGYIFVTGRIKELIIKGGENIAPREVDEALYHHPMVVEAAAFACPSSNYGQRVEAAVAIQSGSVVSEEELLALCKERLGDFKSPDHVHFLPELPKGPSGKIQRLKLTQLFA